MKAVLNLKQLIKWMHLFYSLSDAILKWIFQCGKDISENRVVSHM